MPISPLLRALLPYEEEEDAEMPQWRPAPNTAGSLTPQYEDEPESLSQFLAGGDTNVSGRISIPPVNMPGGPPQLPTGRPKPKPQQRPRTTKTAPRKPESIGLPTTATVHPKPYERPPFEFPQPNVGMQQPDLPTQAQQAPTPPMPKMPDYSGAGVPKDPYDKVMFENQVLHGKEQHTGWKNRLGHAWRGLRAGVTQAGRSAIVRSGQDPGGALGAILAGAIRGGLTGAISPKQGDIDYNRAIVEPEAERQRQKQMVQQNIEFEKQRQEMQIQVLRQSIEGAQQQSDIRLRDQQIKEAQEARAIEKHPYDIAAAKAQAEVTAAQAGQIGAQTEAIRSGAQEVWQIVSSPDGVRAINKKDPSQHYFYPTQGNPRLAVQIEQELNAVNGTAAEQAQRELQPALRDPNAPFNALLNQGYDPMMVRELMEVWGAASQLQGRMENGIVKGIWNPTGGTDEYGNTIGIWTEGFYYGTGPDGKPKKGDQKLWEKMQVYRQAGIEALREQLKAKFEAELREQIRARYGGQVVGAAGGSPSPAPQAPRPQGSPSTSPRGPNDGSNVRDAARVIK